MVLTLVLFHSVTFKLVKGELKSELLSNCQSYAVIVPPNVGAFHENVGEENDNPSILLKVDNEIFDQKEKISSMNDAVRNMIEYCYREKAEGTAIRVILKHLKGAFKGRANSKNFKQLLFCNQTEDSKKLKMLFLMQN